MGPTIPPRFPIAFIRPIAAAAASLCKNFCGTAQNAGAL